MNKFISTLDNWNPFDEKNCDNTTKDDSDIVKGNTDKVSKPLFTLKSNIFSKKISQNDINGMKSKSFYKNDDSHIHQWKIIKSKNSIRQHKSDKLVNYCKSCNKYTNGKHYCETCNKKNNGRYHCEKCNKKYYVLAMCVYNGYTEKFEFAKSINSRADLEKIIPCKLPYEFLECSCKPSSKYVCEYCLYRCFKSPHSLTLSVIDNSMEFLYKQHGLQKREKIGETMYNRDEVIETYGETSIVYKKQKYIPYNLRKTRTQLYRDHLGMSYDEILPNVYSSDKYDYYNRLRVNKHPLFMSVTAKFKSEPDIISKDTPMLNLKTIQFKH
jgi:hypothetical protein